MAQPTGGGSARRVPTVPPISGGSHSHTSSHTHDPPNYHWHDKQVGLIIYLQFYIFNRK